MRILMVTSEAVPLCKSGGLADVACDLSKALARKGGDVRIILPYYRRINTATEHVTGIKVQVLGETRTLQIEVTVINGVPYYLVKDPLFNERPGLYNDPETGEAYADNFLRYTVFQKAVIELCKQIKWIPDILHCNDWTSGLLPYFIKGVREFAETKTVFTIHNLGYQGVFPKYEYIQTAVPAAPELFTGNCVNMLRSGLLFADRITTVSENYADEIKTKQYGCGLEDVLNSRKDVLSGILNGIDTDIWNPETDPFLPYNFTKENLTGKEKTKQAVLKEFNLSPSKTAPLFVMISRLAQQKGVDMLLEILPELLENNDIRVLIIGTGNKEYERRYTELSALFPEKLSVNLIFSDEKAHRAEAAGDFFLMPSLYEPCGLNQMFSQRYATLPIATRTGGLADSIGDGETGFLIDPICEETLKETIYKAVSMYNTDKFVKMRKEAMSRDFSWGASALKYMALYEDTVNGGI